MGADAGTRPPGSAIRFAWRGRTYAGRHALPVLAVATAIGGLGLAAGGTAGPLLGAELISPAGAGLPPGVTVLGSAVAALVIARYSARAGRAPALALGYLAGALGAALVIVAAAAHSVATLLAGSWVLGAANAAVFLTRYAAAELGGRSARGYSIGVVLAATAVGAVTSPNLLGPGGRIAAALGTTGSAGLYLVAVIVFILAAALLAVLARTGDGRAETAGSRPRLHRHELAVALTRPRVRAALLILAITNLIMVAVMTVAPVHMEADGHQLAVIGMMVSVHVTGMLAPSPLTGRLADRFGAAAVAKGGTALLVVVGILGAFIGAGHAPVQTAVLGLLGLAWNAGVVGASAMLAESVPPALRPHVEGIGEAAMGTAAAVGASLAGPVLTHGGMPAVWALSTVLAALCCGPSLNAVPAVNLPAAGENADRPRRTTRRPAP